MFDGIRNSSRLRELTWRSFWEDVGEPLVDVVLSRSIWVAVGNAGTVVCAVAGVVRHWSDPLVFADYLLVQLACLFCQAVALFPVVSPGRRATPQDVRDYAGIHEGLTTTTLFGVLFLAFIPGVVLLLLFGADADAQWGAVLFMGTALVLACIAGLIAGGVVSDRVRARRRAAGGHGWEDDDDGTAGGDADTAGSDGD
ncbi:hypothetical protein [Streptomyces sp. t39]|uniref:hypothetical protein n=1 Tax=Streptomyces sp. t39 TaxID=1828156 RepID=UPI0011CE92BC|nr:hypothetical protein [Streptomyces sp. t39]TXS52235.1 hypothetical protein EAO77_20735 [Streptomyces sp. t39]